MKRTNNKIAPKFHNCQLPPYPILLDKTSPPEHVFIIRYSLFHMHCYKTNIEYTTGHIENEAIVPG